MPKDGKTPRKLKKVKKQTQVQVTVLGKKHWISKILGRGNK